jgi:signal transduction histidine kinase
LPFAIRALGQTHHAAYQRWVKNGVLAAGTGYFLVTVIDVFLRGFNRFNVIMQGTTVLLCGVACWLAARDRPEKAAALAIGAFCTASIPDGVVELRVEDAGEGMDAMTLRRAFEPFFTSAPFGDRTGLGLAVVHGVVSQNDGSVHLESHVGRGTSVRVDWPVSGDV